VHSGNRGAEGVLAEIGTARRHDLPILKPWYATHATARAPEDHQVTLST
jgi:hypothetical protein